MQLAAVQRVPRQSLYQAARPHEREAVDDLLSRSNGQTLGAIRQDLVDLTDRKMARANLGALAGLGGGAAAGLAAGMAGHPALGWGLLAGGVAACVACGFLSFQSIEENTQDLHLLLSLGGRALEERGAEEGAARSISSPPSAWIIA